METPLQPDEICESFTYLTVTKNISQCLPV